MRPDIPLPPLTRTPSNVIPELLFPHLFIPELHHAEEGEKIISIIYDFNRVCSFIRK